MKSLILFLLALVACCGVACKSLNPATSQGEDPAADQQTQSDLHFWAYLAASVGAEYTLAAHPEYRPAFERAVTALDALLASDKIEPLSFRLILQQLPVKELQSPEARLAITTATILFQRYGSSIPIDQSTHVATAAIAVRDGLRAALTATQP